MSKMSKAVAVLGVVAGLGVAAMPLSTYAATGDYIENADLKLNAQVNGSIAIAVQKGTNPTGGSFNAGDGTTTATVLDFGELMVNGPVKKGSVKVAVYSNTQRGYKLTIAPKTAETAMIGTASADNKINANASLAQGVAGWGFAVRADGASDADFGDITSWRSIADTTGDNLVLKSAGTTNTAVDDTDPTSVHSATTNKDFTPSKKDVTEVVFGMAADQTTVEDTYTTTVTFTATAQN